MKARVVELCAWAALFLVAAPFFLVSFALLSEQDKDEIAQLIEDFLDADFEEKMR